MSDSEERERRIAEIISAADPEDYEDAICCSESCFDVESLTNKDREDFAQRLLRAYPIDAIPEHFYLDADSSIMQVEDGKTIFAEAICRKLLEELGHDTVDSGSGDSAEQRTLTFLRMAKRTWMPNEAEYRIAGHSKYQHGPESEAVTNQFAAPKDIFRMTMQVYPSSAKVQTAALEFLYHILCDMDGGGNANDGGQKGYEEEWTWEPAWQHIMDSDFATLIGVALDRFKANLDFQLVASKLFCCYAPKRLIEMTESDLSKTIFKIFTNVLEANKRNSFLDATEFTMKQLKDEGQMEEWSPAREELPLPEVMQQQIAASLAFCNWLISTLQHPEHGEDALNLLNQCLEKEAFPVTRLSQAEVIFAYDTASRLPVHSYIDLGGNDTAVVAALVDGKLEPELSVCQAQGYENLPLALYVAAKDGDMSLVYSLLLEMPSILCVRKPASIQPASHQLNPSKRRRKV